MYVLQTYDIFVVKFFANKFSNTFSLCVLLLKSWMQAVKFDL